MIIEKPIEMQSPQIAEVVKLKDDSEWVVAIKHEDQIILQKKMTVTEMPELKPGMFVNVVDGPQDKRTALLLLETDGVSWEIWDPPNFVKGRINTDVITKIYSRGLGQLWAKTE